MKRPICAILALACMTGCATAPSDSGEAMLAQRHNPAPAPKTTATAAQQGIHQPMAEETAHAADPINLVNAVDPNDDRVVAMVNKKPITLGDLQKPLLEGYGLKVLLFQVQLKLAQQKAAEQNIKWTQADIDAEMERTLKAGFGDADKADYPNLLSQLLERKGVSRAEFEMVVETNAILRKIAEPQLKDRITDDNLKQAFNTLYGQTAVVRHIQVANPQEAMQVRTRIAAGEKFEDLAKTVSRNARTAPLDGELPPFTQQTVNWPGGLGTVPQSFKAFAFNAKVGDLSDPIQAEGGYHILKLEKKVEPKAIKFEDVKDSLRAELSEKLVEQGVSELRNQLAGLARNAMEIKDPLLKAQFDQKLTEQQRAIDQEKKMREEIKNRTLPGTTRPATAPAATQKATPQGTPAGDAASPAKAPAGERPPATGAGEKPEQPKGK